MGSSLPKFDIYQGIAPYLRTTQTLDALIFLKKKFFLMSGLKFTMPDVTSFLPNYLPGIKRIISGL